MVTIGEIESREQELNTEEQKALAITRERIPERKFGSGVTQQKQQEVINRRNQAQKVLREIAVQRQQLSEYKQRLQRYNQAQADYNTEQQKYNEYQQGRKLALEGKYAGKLSKAGYEGYKEVLDTKSQQLAREKEKFEKEGLQPVYQDGKIIAFNDTRTGQSYPVSSVGNVVTEHPEQQQRFERVGFTFTTKETHPLFEAVKQRDEIVTNPLSTTQKIKLTYEEINKKVSSKFDKVGLTDENIDKSVNLFLGNSIKVDVLGYRYVPEKPNNLITGFVSGELKDIKNKPLKNLAIFGLGYGTGLAIKGVGIGAKALQTATKLPIVPISEYGLGGAGLGLTGIYGYNVGKDVYGTKDYREKGEIIGVAVKDLVLFGYGTKKGMKSYDTLSDWWVTRNAKEVPYTKIVAAEFLAGQKYPQIFRGQTAGQLRDEFFKPIKELGEIGRLPRAFTTTPNSFKTFTEIQKGGSELFGGYGSPGANPSFLKLAGEQRTFGITGLLSVGRPTTLRSELLGIELVPGVKPTQTNLRVYDKDLLRFFGGGTVKKGGKRIKVDLGEPIAKRGYGYIPFMKTEKELVEPFGSKVFVSEPEFFFKFNERRIPIRRKISLETYEKLPKVEQIKFKDINEFYKSSSSYYEGISSPSITPLTTSLPFYSKKSSTTSSNSTSTSFSSLSGSLSKSKSTQSSGSGVSSKLFSLSSYSGKSLSKGLDLLGFGSSSYYNKKQSKSTPSTIYKKGNDKKIMGDIFKEAFRVFTFKGGKKLYLKGGLPKGKALRFGQEYTLKNLRATFGIERSGSTKESDISFTPSNKIFRGYRFKQGKKIPLSNMFIQRSGSKREGGLGRLITLGELSDIRRYKRKKK